MKQSILSGLFLLFGIYGHSQTSLPHQISDSIYFQNTQFKIVKQNGEIKLINRVHSIDLNGFLAIAEIQKDVAYQAAIGNHLQMITGAGELTDSAIGFYGRGICGTVDHYTNTIYKIGDSTFIKYITKQPNDEETITIDSAYLGTQMNLSFFNGQKTFSYTENDMFDQTINQNTFLQVLKNHKLNVLSISKTDSGIQKTYLLKKIEPFIGNNKYIGPFIFKRNKLYGYYPITKKERFKTISVFDKYFAAFTLPNGDKGWLDRNGKEYIYEKSR